MTKAKEVRMRRLASIKETKEEAQKIFEWILELLDERTLKKDFSPLTISTDGNYITADQKNYKGYQQCDCSKSMFQAVKEVIDAEEGYSSGPVEEKFRCISLTVVIE